MSNPIPNDRAAKQTISKISPLAPEINATRNRLAENPQPPRRAFSAFGSISQFENAKRMARMLARSALVPEGYRGNRHLGNCVIALEIANRIGAPVLAVMQNLQLVLGKPGWSSQFLISCVNSSKRFSPLRYEFTGKRGADTWGCHAWAIDKTGQILKSPEVTLRMAKAEGWYDRLGSKWKTMPELMLCYRSAALFTRLYAPDVTMGIQTMDEAADMGPTPVGNTKTSRPVFDREAARKRFAVKRECDSRNVISMPLRTVPASKSHEPLKAAPRQPDAGNTLAPPCGQYNYLKALTGFVGSSKHSEAEVVKFLNNTRRCETTLTSLPQLAETQPNVIIWTHDNWKAVDQEIARLKKGKTV
jgi:hypothetical protein